MILVSIREGWTMRRLIAMMKDQAGTTSVEYSVMLGFILLVLIGTVAAIGNTQHGTWNGIWGQMQQHGM